MRTKDKRLCPFCDSTMTPHCVSPQCRWVACLTCRIYGEPTTGRYVSYPSSAPRESGESKE